MLKGIKIRLYLNKEQEAYVNQLLGTYRFVYNQSLSYKIEKYKGEKKSVGFGELGRKLVELKSEYPWMRGSHSKVLQQSIIDMNKAYDAFFKKQNSFPKFKSKHDNRKSCRFPSDAISGLNGNRINIIKSLWNVHFKCSISDQKYLNKNQEKIRSGTLSKTPSGKHFFSILIDDTRVKSLPETDSDIGIDLGIKDFIVTSNGDRYENIKIRRNNERGLKRLHRKLSRRKKGSRNRNKARIELARNHEKLNNKKDYYLHHIANRLLSENQTIAIEDLNVAGMLKNHKLAKSIQELSISRFVNILEYKAEWYGRSVVKVGRFFPSSKLCSECGHKNDELTLKDRIWTCTGCGSEHDRDLNAARNILMEGKKIKIGLSSPELTPLESSSLEHSLN
jgi:putative transposase